MIDNRSDVFFSACIKAPTKEQVGVEVKGTIGEKSIKEIEKLQDELILPFFNWKASQKKQALTSEDDVKTGMLTPYLSKLVGKDQKKNEILIPYLSKLVGNSNMDDDQQEPEVINV